MNSGDMRFQLMMLAKLLLAFETLFDYIRYRSVQSSPSVVFARRRGQERKRRNEKKKKKGETVTHVISFSRMIVNDFNVLVQVLIRPKSFIALITCTRFIFLCSMTAYVRLEMTFATEICVTRRTFEWSLRTTTVDRESARKGEK